MFSRFNLLLVLMMLSLAGVLGACSNTPEGDEGGGVNPGAGGAAAPLGGMAAPSGGSGGTTSSGGGGTTPIASGGGAGGAAGGGDAMPGGAGGVAGGLAGVGGVGGVGGEAGAAGMAGVAGGVAGSMAMPREDLGQGDGNDVVTIGDSFMNLSLGSGIEFSLEKVSGRNYRNYAAPGTQVLNGQIPGQWTRAKNAGADIKSVIMTGGCNDIILDFFGNLLACQGAKTEADLSNACVAALEEITVGVTALMDTMETDGVLDVIYVGYGYVTNNELGGTIERTKRVQTENCRDDDPTKTMRCHWVDPSQQLIGKISADGIHPTVAGYDTIAEMVWQRMQDEGMRR
jgi:hypothetical protein